MKRHLISFAIGMILSTGISANDNDSLEIRNSPLSIHFSSPLGIINKVGVKFEARFGRHAALLTGTHYFIWGIPYFPGEQLGMEYRRYVVVKNPSLRKDYFFYGKLLAGHQRFVAEIPGNGGFDFFSGRPEVPEDNYIGAGAGMGQKFLFRKFFMEMSFGMKGVATQVRENFAFYASGPGSIIDLHFNWGFKL